VGRTPGEPEEPRSTKAQYTCRPYRCTKYICLYICWAAGFDDLGWLLFSFNMSFLLRKVEDVTTISKSQSLTSVSINDCTFRVPNKTTTLFLVWAIIKAIFIHWYIWVHAHPAVFDSTSTLAGKSGPSARDRHCARGLGGIAKKRRGNGQE